MRRPRLFCPQLSVGCVVLSAEESHHAIGVLRAKPGDEVVLFDGAGREGVGRIMGIDRKRLAVELVGVATRPFELPHRITLAVAMGRAHRQGYLVEKCTELGVAAIWPIIADRSVSRSDAASVEKWSRRAVEAAKQSDRSWVPTIAAPRTFSQTIERINDFVASSLTVTSRTATPFHQFLTAQSAGSTVLVCVGPEGGWSDAECERAFAAGAVATTLGPTVLRTETAAVAVCAAACLLGVSHGPGTAGG